MNQIFTDKVNIDKIVLENPNAKIILIEGKDHENSVILWQQDKIPKITYNDRLTFGNIYFNTSESGDSLFNNDIVLSKNKKRFIREPAIAKWHVKEWRFIITDIPTQILTEQIDTILNFKPTEKRYTVYLFE